MNQVGERNSQVIRFPPSVVGAKSGVSEIIDVDSLDDANPHSKTTTIHIPKAATSVLDAPRPESTSCIGIQLVFPPGKDHHTSYPFGLHYLVKGKAMDSTVNEGFPCSKCGPRTSIDRSNGQRMLEHMGAHILHDSSIPSNLEVCGLCLRPAPMCTLYLKKGRGGSKGYSVDMNRSTCVNLIRFKYASAATSTEIAPCTNIPIHCPLCGPKQPAVWRYSLGAHFQMKHDLQPADFPIRVQQSESEKNGLEQIWKKRFQIRKKRNLKNKKALPLNISTAHSVGLSE